jgi:hypothetical protein
MPAGPVHFEVENSPATVVVVTGSDGQRYEARIALLIMGASDTGLLSPLDGLPVFNIATQVVAQVKRVANG